MSSSLTYLDVPNNFQELVPDNSEIYTYPPYSGGQRRELYGLNSLHSVKDTSVLLVQSATLVCQSTGDRVFEWL
jgi:hypothetical protein